MTADATATATHMVHAINADTGAEARAGPSIQRQGQLRRNGLQLGGPEPARGAGAGRRQALRAVQRPRRRLPGVPRLGHRHHDRHQPGGQRLGDPRDRGRIWGASGIASDGTSLFFATGNSKSSGSAGPNTSSGDNGGTWGDSETVFKFPASLASPAPATTTDYFRPGNWIALDDADADIGGTSPILLNVPGATPSALVVALGKDDNAYLLDRANLGGWTRRRWRR